jgi:hypothetical protein
MMYKVFIMNRIHHLMTESKILIFAYNSDRRVYFILFPQAKMKSPLMWNMERYLAGRASLSSGIFCLEASFRANMLISGSSF